MTAYAIPGPANRPRVNSKGKRFFPCHICHASHSYCDHFPAYDYRLTPNSGVSNTVYRSSPLSPPNKLCAASMPNDRWIYPLEIQWPMIIPLPPISRLTHLHCLSVLPNNRYCFATRPLHPLFNPHTVTIISHKQRLGNNFRETEAEKQSWASTTQLSKPTESIMEHIQHERAPCQHSLKYLNMVSLLSEEETTEPWLPIEGIKQLGNGSGRLRLWAF